MSAPLLGCLAALFSAICIVVLAATDRKRRRSSAGLRRVNLAALALVFAPGLGLAVTVQSVAFLIWIGATAVTGWGIAAAANLDRSVEPRRR